MSSLRTNSYLMRANNFYIILYYITCIWQTNLSEEMYNKCMPKVIGTTTKH
uniref:Uncharacterized protein n=1 Tax=Anguilla anguilla TaxID=7936 RepID=A0A0E9SQA2_ANGAN